MRVPAAAVIFSFLCSGAFAQENPNVERSQQSTTTTSIPPTRTPGESSSIHPEWRSDRSALPDAPRPQLDDHERTPCPEGEFKPCALLGGRRYLPDHTRMTQHDKTVWDGFTHPMILAGSALLVAITVYDIEGTQSCLHAGTCRETNPIHGSHPSRARADSIAMPLNGFLIYLSARQKRRGDGNTAFAALYLSSAAHFYFERYAYSAASGVEFLWGQFSGGTSCASHYFFIVALCSPLPLYSQELKRRREIPAPPPRCIAVEPSREKGVIHYEYLTGQTAKGSFSTVAFFASTGGLEGCCGLDALKEIWRRRAESNRR